MVVMTPSTVMPPPRCGKKLAIAERKCENNGNIPFLPGLCECRNFQLIVFTALDLRRVITSAVLTRSLQDWKN